MYIFLLRVAFYRVEINCFKFIIFKILNLAYTIFKMNYLFISDVLHARLIKHMSAAILLLSIAKSLLKTSNFSPKVNIITKALNIPQILTTRILYT